MNVIIIAAVAVVIIAVSLMMNISKPKSSDDDMAEYSKSKGDKKEFSKPEVLKKTSEGLPSNLKGKQLKSIEDYFYYVFVPSRQNGRVDDIEYLTPTKVRVWKIEPTRKLIFYNLEKIDDRWLLVP